MVAVGIRKELRGGDEEEKENCLDGRRSYEEEVKKEV